MGAPAPLMGRLPAFFVGRRRRRVALVVLAGIVQALASAGAALLAPRILTSPPGQRWPVVVVLGVAAAAVGLAKWGERVVCERLAQKYVHDLRMDLIRSALTGEGNSSLGVIVARTTNDLTAVRSWIVLGIVPLLVGAPIVLGVVVGLALLHPVLAGAALLPLGVLAAGLLGLSPLAYTRARALRRRRGRMASHIADTVTAGESVRRAGGISREVSAIADRSRSVVDHAVSRAVVTGGMRGLASGVSASAIMTVAVAAAAVGVDAATIASAFMLVGLLTMPLTDLGRIGELRQGFLAAEYILAPHIGRARAYTEAEKALAEGRDAQQLLETDESPPPGVVHVADLDLGRGPIEFLAHPGERLVLTSTDPDRLRAAVAALTGSPGAPRAWVNVAGHLLGDLPGKARRLLVGSAGPEVALERGTLARAVRYRVPGSEADIEPYLEAVGLADLPARLEKGERTRLRAGGAPLSHGQRARVALARALYDEPPLVVIDRLDASLGADGHRVVRDALARYRGVAVLVTDRPDTLGPDVRRVDLDGHAMGNRVG